jgi:hypothetical protein
MRERKRRREGGRGEERGRARLREGGRERERERGRGREREGGRGRERKEKEERVREERASPRCCSERVAHKHVNHMGHNNLSTRVVGQVALGDCSLNGIPGYADPSAVINVRGSSSRTQARVGLRLRAGKLVALRVRRRLNPMDSRPAHVQTDSSGFEA